MRRFIYVSLCVFALCVPACQASQAGTTAASTNPLVSATITRLPSTLTPTGIPTSTLALTPTRFAPFDIVTSVANVNLRVNPGMLFPALRLLEEGSPLLVLGRAPGDEWFLVRTDEDIEGWVFHWLINSEVDLKTVPVYEPRNTQLIKGEVRDGNGTAIRGVGFTLTQGNGLRASTNTVLTDADGVFYSYMPADAAGTWTAEYSAIACDSNVWKADGCSDYKDQYKGNVEPPSMDVTLPATETMDFLWR